MRDYNIKTKEIKKVTYVTQDGHEFETKESAYLYNSYDFMNYILENNVNSLKVDTRFFKDDVIESYKFYDKEQLDMFLYAYLDYFEVSNVKEVKEKAENRISFPCVLCNINDGSDGSILFFKEDLFNELTAIIGKMKK